ncbi:DUF2000 domain-containing protein [Glaciihabitans sp. dw_435]|uniref:DUF2000 domain-containing protein n=1 Tax=Glaciihabitans sp. dw_435 TaxID=2720081 RepID=UPI001BD286C4|nr:DUF2000 domain-containing protein [Glaciihabitans sp. dw_435]
MTTEVGFAPDEIDTSAPTRAARLKWVIVVNDSLSPGLAVNAASCVSAATSQHIAGLLGEGVVDLDGSDHPGLPWAGCSVLEADVDSLRVIRAKADAHPETFVVDMPAAAQQTRVYDEYRAAVAESSGDAIDYYAVSIVGPRNAVDRIVKRLSLLG